jgi:hypothetical protein
MATTVKQSRRRRLRVGDQVKIHFAGRDIVARVIEDRGLIGIKGRQLVRVSAANLFGEPGEFELPAEEVEVVARSEKLGI